MASKITITFNADAVASDYVEVVYKKGTGIPITRRETFRDIPRNASGYCQTQTPTANVGEASAIEYADKFNIDYGYPNWVLAILNINEVIIIIGKPDLCLLTFDSFDSNNINITAVIENCYDVVGTPLSLVETIISDAPVPCNSVRASIETNVVVPEIWLNGTQIETVNALNPYIVDLPRGIKNRLLFIDGTNTLYEPSYPNKEYFFATFNEDSINIDVNPSLLSGSATVIVNVIVQVSNPIQTFEYSLNGVDYQSNNIFTGQSSGSKTMYVRDNWGCIKTKDYIVNQYGTRDPFLFISKANSISFVENEVVDGYSIFKNENNSFAFNGFEDIKYCETQLYQTNDVVTIQFKSNYDTPTVFLRHEDGSPDTSLTLTKRTSNLNKFQNMDCWYYKYANGLLGIYFTSGNTYDEIDLEDGTFLLNGNLPDFAIVGVFVEIAGLGIFEIKDVVYDSSINKKSIIVEHVYNGIPTATTIKAYYDLLPFEIYEFTIDWSIYGVGTYDILIDNTDTINGTVQHLSENIVVADEHEKTLAIRYYNNNNRDIFYKYGLENFIRVPYLHVEADMYQEGEVNITDLITSVTESSVNEGDKFFFEEVTKSMMRKLVIALNCENVFINGIGYVRNGEIEKENTQSTNLYTVIAPMIKTNINYNNNRQGQEGIDDGSIIFNIPAFITDGSNHLKA